MELPIPRENDPPEIPFALRIRSPETTLELPIPPEIPPENEEFAYPPEITLELPSPPEYEAFEYPIVPGITPILPDERGGLEVLMGLEVLTTFLEVPYIIALSMTLLSVQ